MPAARTSVGRWPPRTGWCGAVAGGDYGIGYRTWALPAGTYCARVMDVLGGDYGEQWYSNILCAVFDIGSATTIPVVSSDVGGIDFSLGRMNVSDQTDKHIIYAGAKSVFSTTSAYGGSYTRLTALGSSATIYFNGIRLDWIAMRGTTTGKANVYVDGVLKETVDLSSPTAVYKVKVFTTGDLPRGPHKVGDRLGRGHGPIRDHRCDSGGWPGCRSVSDGNGAPAEQRLHSGR